MGSKFEDLRVWAYTSGAIALLSTLHGHKKKISLIINR